MENSRAVRVLSLICAFSCAVCATGIEGQLTPSKGRLPGELTVQVYADGRVVDTIHVNDDGSFRLSNLASGSYEFRVLDIRGDTLRSHFVAVGAHAGWLELRVPGIEQDRPVSGTVSLKMLATTIPRAAKKAIARSDKAFRSGNLEESIEQLKTALESCPDCVQVHNNLGTRYMRTGAFADAVHAFERAVTLDPASALAQSNLAIALIASKDFTAAEGPARRAFDLDRSSLAARYALGFIAIARRDCTREALDHLKAAAELYPRAQLSIASVLLCRGETNAAVDELTAYLSRPNAEHRDKVERWRTEISAGRR